MSFEFSTAQRIIFGRNALTELPDAISNWGRHALVVTGQSSTHYDRLEELLGNCKIKCRRFTISGEPSVEVISSGLECIRGDRPDFVIGIGGGSALDAAKAMAALLANTGDIFAYLEVIGQGRPLERSALPCVAIPTTAGTGSEVTSNAVLGSIQHGVKVSMRNPSMIPNIAIVDPELTLTVPPGLTASTGMDALTQCIEAFVSCKSNPLVDGLCREGIRRSARSLRCAFRDGDNLDAREDMALAALFSGIALSNAKLGAVHGIAGPMGGTTGAPHGLICANLLFPVMKTNLRALRTREPDNQALQRFSEVAHLLTGNPGATAEDGVAWIEQLYCDLTIPASLGLEENQIPDLIRKCRISSSMKGNPLVLSPSEIGQLLSGLL